MEREYAKKDFVREMFDCYGAMANHLGRSLRRWTAPKYHTLGVNLSPLNWSHQLDYVNVSYPLTYRATVTLGHSSPPAYLNTIQSTIPLVLRKVSVATVLSRRARATGAAAAAPMSSPVRHTIREIVKVVQLEEYRHSDPIPQFC